MGGDNGNMRFRAGRPIAGPKMSRTRYGAGRALAIDFSFRVQLEEFYIHEPVWPVHGGGGYNISLASAHPRY